MPPAPSQGPPPKVDPLNKEAGWGGLGEEDRAHGFGTKAASSVVGANPAPDRGCKKEEDESRSHRPCGGLASIELAVVPVSSSSPHRTAECSRRRCFRRCRAGVPTTCFCMPFTGRNRRRIRTFGSGEGRVRCGNPCAQHLLPSLSSWRCERSCGRSSVSDVQVCMREVSARFTYRSLR